jgi:phosphatidylinositol alpha-1,6-mannosyltransferase
MLYLSIGVFDKGGVARYSRYQIRALRELLGTREVTALSVREPEPGGFEEPFGVDYYAGGLDWQSRIRFGLAAWRKSHHMRAPRLVWASHLYLGLLGWMVRRLLGRGTKLVVNIYGEEIWSGRVSQHKWVLRRADLVIADCHFSADYVRDHYGIPQERLRVLWDCVDVTRFRPMDVDDETWKQLKIPRDPQAQYVLTLGRLDKLARYKGYDRLIDAMAALQHKMPHLIAVIAGDGNDRARLEARVSELGLTGRVVFTGSVPESLLVPLYNTCDLFVLISDRGAGRGEGLPLVGLEAAACGKPVIMGNEDGSQEGVVEGITGHIVSPREPESIVAAIEDILASPGKAEEMGRAGRQRIERDMSFEAFRNSLADFMKPLALAAAVVQSL